VGNETTVKLSVFATNGASASLQKFYDLNNDTKVTFDDYVRVGASIKEFNTAAAISTTTPTGITGNFIALADIYSADYGAAKFEFFDADSNGFISLEEHIAGELRIVYDADTVYQTYLAAAVKANFTEGLNLTAWTKLGETASDFTWRDIDKNGLLENWEFIEILFEIN
jgi:hypothetical protein